MIKDLRYPLKQRPFPQRTLVLAVPRRVGLWVGLLDFEVQLGIGLRFGLGLAVQRGIGLWFGLGLEVPDFGWTWTFGPKTGLW